MYVGLPVCGVLHCLAFNIIHRLKFAYVSVNSHVNKRLSLEQEAFEKCWAHSPLRAVLHFHSPGVATVARRHCLKLPVHRCPRQRRQRRVTEGTAMAP